MKAVVTKTMLAGATFLAIAASGSAAADSIRCDLFAFRGETHQSAPNSPFVGGATLMNLGTGETVDADVSTVLLGLTGPTEAVTSHEIRADGSPGIHLMTIDDAQLIPLNDQGEFQLISRMRVKTGQGAYNCGELVIGAPPPGSGLDPSTVNLESGEARFSGLARLCRCKPADN